MTLKTFYKPFLFKSIEGMDTICVVLLLHYKPMMGVLCFRPSSFCVNEPFLYSCNIVLILIKLIFFKGGIFLNNHNNVVFAWVLCMRNMTCSKTGNDVLKFLYWSLYTSLCAYHATLSCSRFFRSSLSNAIVAFFSSIAC